jgi:hypothetical protein
MSATARNSGLHDVVAFSLGDTSTENGASNCDATERHGLAAKGCPTRVAETAVT